MKQGLLPAIPIDWKVARVDDNATRGTGHTPDKEIPGYWHGGILWVSLADSFRLDQVIIDSTESTISELGIKKSSAVVHDAGTVILSRDAGVGKSAILAKDMAVSQHFVTWKTTSTLSNLFFYYWLQFMKREFELVAVGSTIKTIGLPYFRRMEILLPNRWEQDWISQCLYRYDRAISLTERLITAKLKQRKGLMQQLLTGKRRFPGFSEPWREVHLREVTTESLARNNGQLGRDAVRAVTNSAGMIPMREQTIADVLDRYMVVKRRAFAYNPMRINVGSLCMWSGEEPCLVSPDYVVFNCKAGELDADYFDYLRQTHRWNFYMQGAGNGSVRVRIYYDDLAALKFVIPPFPEQIRISAFLRSYDRELSLLRTQLAALKTQKRGLMQQLLTGKVRVQVADAAA
jgi:type I restriction enzyme S subunit